MDTKQGIAALLDHSVLHQLHTADDVRAGCELAKKYQVASLCIKPCHVVIAAESLEGSGVPVCAVTGFPHGNSVLSVKLAETQAALNAGATEIDTVINLALVRDADWPAVHMELEQLQMLVDSHEGVFKAIFETGLLNDEEIKKICEIAASIPLDFVKTSTGFVTVKDSSGKLVASGASEHAVRLMADSVAGRCKIKASGGIRTLDDVLRYRELGCSRIGTSSTQHILDSVGE